MVTISARTNKRTNEQIDGQLENNAFTDIFDRYFHIPLPIVTKHDLGLPFLPRNLPIKFGTNPSTILLSYHGHRQTDTHTHTHTHTHKPTPVKTLPRFCGEKKRTKSKVCRELISLQILRIYSCIILEHLLALSIYLSNLHSVLLVPTVCMCHM